MEIRLPKIYKITYQERAFRLRTVPMQRHLSWRKSYDAHFVPYEDLASACDEADIIITSSAARPYTVLPKFFKSLKPRLILDLSVPQNVDPAVNDLPEITVAKCR